MYASDLKHPYQSLENKLQILNALGHSPGIILSIRPEYIDLLHKLGNPHLNLPPVIHVAGTNGKGSIIAMLRAVLEEAGYSVHAYTSPHLIKFNERIVLGGKPISDANLEELIDEALALNENNDLTFFEITTAIALTTFARTQADICLLEVGMGGRLDSTNIIEKPLLTIINTIGMDHAEYLGETLREIADEKAGIMKQGVPCVIGHQNDETVIDMFKNKAAELDIELHHANLLEQPYETSLVGDHQKTNMSTALTALELIKDQFPVTNAQIRQGLQNAHWPARLQKLDANAYGLEPNTELYLDGGHNTDAGHALAVQAAKWQVHDNKPLYVILGMMKGKNAQDFLEPLSPFINQLCVVNIKGEPQSQSTKDLLKIFPHARTFENYADALAQLQTQKSGRILICGSLYLAGHVLQDALKT